MPKERRIWRGGEGGRGHCGALYSLLNVRKLLILWPAISAGQIELNFSLIAVEQLPAVAQRSVGRGHAAWGMDCRGQFPKWPLAGANWATKCTNRIMAPHSNCQLPIAIGSAETINRSFDRCIAAFSSAPLSLPCSALGHVLQTFCCRLLKVISLLRAGFPSLSPRSLCSDSIWFLWLHVDAFSLHVFMSCRKVAARLRCWAGQRTEGRAGGCICCSICGSLSAI